MTNKTLVILAAGIGSRYGGNKQTDGFGPNGEMIMDYSIYDAIQNGFNKVVFVIRKEFYDNFKIVIEKRWKDKAELHYVFQSTDDFIPVKYRGQREKPWGTGHAILCCKNVVNEPFVMINADDYYGTESFKIASHFLSHKCTETLYGLIGYRLKQVVSDYGSVSRGVCFAKGDKLDHIVENKNVFVRQGKIISKTDSIETELSPDTIVSMNLLCFHHNIFKGLEDAFSRFIEKYHNELKTEFLIPKYIDNCIAKKQLKVSIEQSPQKWFGVTYKEDADIVKKEFKRLIQQKVYPERL